MHTSIYLLLSIGSLEEDWPTMQSREQSSLTKQQAVECKAALHSSCNAAKVSSCHASKQPAMQCDHLIQHDAEQPLAPAAETVAESQRHNTGHAGCTTVANAAAATQQLGLTGGVTLEHLITWCKSARRAQQQRHNISNHVLAGGSSGSSDVRSAGAVLRHVAVARLVGEHGVRGCQKPEMRSG